MPGQSMGSGRIARRSKPSATMGAQPTGPSPIAKPCRPRTPAPSPAGHAVLSVGHCEARDGRSCIRRISLPLHPLSHTLWLFLYRVLGSLLCAIMSPPPRQNVATIATICRKGGDILSLPNGQNVASPRQQCHPRCGILSHPPDSSVTPVAAFCRIPRTAVSPPLRHFVAS